jgi:hypothetical protein
LRTHLSSSSDVTACSVANFDSTRGICTAAGKKRLPMRLLWKQMRFGMPQCMQRNICC